MKPSFVTPAVPAKPRSVGSLMGDSMRRRGGRRARLSGGSSVCGWGFLGRRQRAGVE